MAHARSQIRDAVKTALTGLATTGANAWANRAYPLTEAELPGLVVSTPVEVSDRHTNTPVKLLRQVDVLVGIQVADNDTAATIVDQIAAEVEAAIGADPTLGGLVKSIHLTRSETGTYREGEKVTAAGRLTFEAVYRTAASDAETIIS